MAGQSAHQMPTDRGTISSTERTFPAGSLSDRVDHEVSVEPLKQSGQAQVSIISSS